ncbi:MAG: MFS transporter [Gemmatimonadetes bacterium]|nr:MFS transporter [Gemmatimonadota bacterium]
MQPTEGRHSAKASTTDTRWGVLLLIALTVLMDGFDVQAMGYVAPAIVKEWGVSRDVLGPVFGAGLFGMLVGSLTLSVLADRMGRRPVLIGATLFFAACMLATTRVTTVEELQALRFVTGLGLGAIMPNAMSLAGESSPAGKRVTLMMLVSCGFTAGAVVGGLVSAALIPAYGWQAVFWVGGAVPIVLAVLMIALLPESGEFTAARRAQGAAVPVTALFGDGRATVTLLLWAINFLNLINLYFLSNWLPTIAASAGMGTSRAVLLGTALQVGGVAGTLVMGPVITRAGFRAVLVTAFVVAAVAIATIGRNGIPAPLLFAAVAVTGFCVIGGQPAVNARAATYYPTALRSTGVGWSLGVGRVGSIVGPVLGGELIRRQWTNEQLFLAVAVPAAAAAVLMSMVRDDGTRRADEPVPE